MPSDVQVKTNQSTTVECPIPATAEQAKQFGNAIAFAASLGQAVIAINLIQTGHQRDPITSGIRVVLRSA